VLGVIAGLALAALTACGGGAAAPTPTTAAASPAGAAAAPSPARPGLASPAASPSPAVVSAVTPAASPTAAEVAGGDTYEIQSGDTLATIAQQFYGDPTEWRRIYDANKDAIGADPDKLKLGTKLTIPPKQS
jgi:nucleoid-associated protein YgaU